MSARVGDLPERLRLRTRVLGGEGEPPAGGEYVLYWARTAVRAYENPALDVAVWLANLAGLPVFVYHAVSERHPYANDRHHTFILEGARDFAEQLHERGIATAFHCERPGHRGPHLVSMAERAHAVVTEDMPVSPLREWAARLDERSACPVWSVDTACVVPRGLVGERVTRAFAFRKKIRRHLRQAMSEWEDVAPAVEPTMPELPFVPVDWQAQPIDELVAACAIDHTVGPVSHTRGGSEAGYARWSAFRETGLGGYAARRNDALRGGVSRMSAYLHYGMVSPMRLAREAKAQGGKGAEKYLDELIIWRELAYGFCTYTENLDSIETLPEWARATLEAHRGDRREAVFDEETLARSRTGDAFWDVAQMSLRVHGELHNNPRMTWGKALIGWTPDAQTALRRLVDLNHRFALDGRDPASYGGLLWCLGQFDRPFEPEQPVFGTVRPRSTAVHAKRLPPERWAAHLGPVAGAGRQRIAVVGAGPAGAFAARTLADHGHEVVLFDKSRGVGGRMATRRREETSFDHGAQYFTMRDPRMTRWLEAWESQGVVRRWQGRFATLGGEGVRAVEAADARYVATPGMTALCKHLVKDVKVELGRRVLRVEPRGSEVELEFEGDEVRSFDYALVTAPAPQAAEMLHGSEGLSSLAQKVEYAPCWAVMVAGEDVVGSLFDAAKVEDSALSWVARETSKPGRGGAERWTLHSTAAWAEEHWERSAEEVGEALLDAFRERVPGSEGLRVVSTQRWRYALVMTPHEQACAQEGRVVLAGDSFGAGRVEAALLSGAAAAGAVLGSLHREAPVEPQQATVVEQSPRQLSLLPSE